MCTIRGPFNTNCAICFIFPDFNLLAKSPNVDFSSKVSKSTDYCGIWKRINSDCISVSLSEFKEGISFFVVEGRSWWLSSRDYYELVSSSWPLNIMDHAIKNWNENSRLALQWNILKAMLSIVAFTRGICKVLRPNQNGITRRWRSDVDFLSLATLDWEFRFFLAKVQIIDIDITSV